MPTSIYQHWDGEMILEASEFPTATHKVDEWFPEKAPEGAVKIAEDRYPAPTDLFENVIRLRGKVGPFKLTVTIDQSFRGTVEYWQTPAPGGGEGGG